MMDELTSDSVDMRYRFLALPLVFVSCPAQAQDASLFAGGMRVDQNEDDTSFAVALGYNHHINKTISVSADYLNEGHPKLHHRGGLQRGWRIPTASETATSYGLEYRRTVNPKVEWSVILMSEGKVDAAERKGVGGQVRLLRPFTEPSSTARTPTTNAIRTCSCSGRASLSNAS